MAVTLLEAGLQNNADVHDFLIPRGPRRRKAARAATRCCPMRVSRQPGPDHDPIGPDRDLISLLEHDLFGKPVPALGSTQGQRFQFML